MNGRDKEEARRSALKKNMDSTSGKKKHVTLKISSISAKTCKTRQCYAGTEPEHAGNHSFDQWMTGKHWWPMSRSQCFSAAGPFPVMPRPVRTSGNAGMQNPHGTSKGVDQKGTIVCKKNNHESVPRCLWTSNMERLWVACLGTALIDMSPSRNKEDQLKLSRLKWELMAQQ